MRRAQRSALKQCMSTTTCKPKHWPGNRPDGKLTCTTADTCGLLEDRHIDHSGVDHVGRAMLTVFVRLRRRACPPTVTIVTRPHAVNALQEVLHRRGHTCTMPLSMRRPRTPPTTHMDQWPGTSQEQADTWLHGVISVGVTLLLWDFQTTISYHSRSGFVVFFQTSKIEVWREGLRACFLSG